MAGVVGRFRLPIGPEQGGIRPAIVVGSTIDCRFPIDMALLVPLTTRDKQLDHHVRIDSPGPGWPSWARTEDITTVSTRRLTQPRPLGRASAEEAEELSFWLRAMVAFS